MVADSARLWIGGGGAAAGRLGGSWAPAAGGLAGRDEAGFAGEHDGLNAVSECELAEDAFDMRLYGRVAGAELTRQEWNSSAVAAERGKACDEDVGEEAGMAAVRVEVRVEHGHLCAECTRSEGGE
jgi:hypothetical protein